MYTLLLWQAYRNRSCKNGKELLLACAGHETEYNPSRESITIAAMQTLSAMAPDALGGVSQAQAVLSIAPAVRETAFKPLSYAGVQAWWMLLRVPNPN